MANNYDQYHNMPIIDLLQMLIPELNQILMAQNMTIDQALNQFNLTTMDLSFIGLPLNLQELMDLNLYQASEFLNLSAFFSPEFNIEALSNMTILEAVGMIDFQSFGFPFDFTKLSIKDIVNLTDFTIFFDPEFNVQLLTSLPLIEVINKFEFIQEFTNTTVGDLFGLVNMEYLLSPDYNLQQLGGLSVSQLITIIDLNVLGMPLNIGGLTSLTVYDLLNSVNMTFLLDPELNVESLANNTIIDTLNTINIGEINVGDVTRLTITDLLAMTNTSFLLDPNFNVEHLSDLPLMDLLGMIDLSMFGMPMTVENLTQLTISEILTLTNLTVLLDPSFNVNNFGNMSIIQLADMAGVNLKVSEVLMMLNASFLLSPELNIQNFAQLNLIQLVGMLDLEMFSVPMKLNELMVQDLIYMLKLDAVFESGFNIQAIMDSRLIDLDLGLPFDFYQISQMSVSDLIRSFGVNQFLDQGYDLSHFLLHEAKLTDILYKIVDVATQGQLHMFTKFVESISMAIDPQGFNESMEMHNSTGDCGTCIYRELFGMDNMLWHTTLHDVLVETNLTSVVMPIIDSIQDNPNMTVFDLLKLAVPIEVITLETTVGDLIQVIF